MSKEKTTPVVETPEVETKPTVETPKVETPKDEIKSTVEGLTQKQVDEIIASRVARERSEILKELGVESIDDAKSRIAKVGETEQELTKKEREIVLIKTGIKEDKYQEALALAKLRGDVPLEDALKQVVADYPSLVGRTDSFGKTAGAELDHETPKYTKEFLRANQHIPHFKKLLEEIK